MSVHLHKYVYNVYVCDILSLGVNVYSIYTGLNGVLLLENESHQTAVAIVVEEDQFADCLDLVSVMSLYTETNNN